MRQNTPSFSENLTHRQTLALPHVACAPTLTQGAELAHIDRSTLQRWMREPHFRAQVERVRDEAASLARVKLQSLMLKSVLILEDSLDNADDALRLRAARATLQAAFRSDDALDLRRRLDMLDDGMSMLKAQR
jgi:hypothetical protein